MPNIQSHKAWLVLQLSCKTSSSVSLVSLISSNLRKPVWDYLLHFIWDALRAAAEADMSLAQAIVDSAGVIVTSADMSTCYDERGTYAYCLLSLSHSESNVLFLVFILRFFCYFVLGDSAPCLKFNIGMATL
ncbi:hypothetical protein AMTRI_Chr01g110280 [Amborella trichopoda]